MQGGLSDHHGHSSQAGAQRLLLGPFGSGGRPPHAARRSAGQLPHPRQQAEGCVLHTVLPRQEWAGQRADRLQAAKVLISGQRALLPDTLCPVGALHQLSQEEPEHPVQEMGANAAGAMQEAHHGAVWWSKPGFGAATQPCGQRLPDGISSQTMTSLPFKVLTVLFLISTLLGHGKPVDVVSPTHCVLPWLRVKSAPCFDALSCKKAKRHDHHSEVETVFNRTGSIGNFSTSITSRDSTCSCTRTECCLVLRKHEKLGNAALRESYRYSGALTATHKHAGSTETVLLETVGSAVALLCPSEVQRNFTVDCGGTLRTLTEWMFGNMEAWWRTRLKPSQLLAPVGEIFVAYLKYSNVFRMFTSEMNVSNESNTT